MKPLLCFLLFLVHFTVVCPAETVAPTPRKQQTLEWFTNARFGMFIHWGLYAIPAGEYQGRRIPGISEWIMKRANIPAGEYERLADQLDLTHFDAEVWAKLARDSGMKYLTITTKHHDGFCLWDSKVTDYDIVDRTRFKRDVLKELAAACEKYGVELCLYYSIMDWHHPDVSYRSKSRNPQRYIDEYMKPQIAELLGGEYGRIPMLWFDGNWEGWFKKPMAEDFYNYIQRISPDTIVNDRIGHGFVDYHTPERAIPAAPTTKIGPNDVWEAVMTTNQSWGYAKHDENWKSRSELIRSMIEVFSRGGNYMLNVGPKADGSIPEGTARAFAEIGDWMRINGESVYGSTYSPVGMMTWGRVTANGNKLYAHIYEWPHKRIAMRLGRYNHRRQPVISVTLLGETHLPLEFERSGDEIRFTLPGKCPDPVATVVVIEFEPK